MTNPETETQDAAAPAPAAKAQKRATISLIVDADVNQNEFKNWLKSCPFSAQGDQTIQWENIAPVDSNVGETVEEAAEKSAA